MSDAYKDEGADDDVKGGDSGYKDQDALGVGCQPDVVLTDEELHDWQTEKMYEQFFFVCFLFC